MEITSSGSTAPPWPPASSRRSRWTYAVDYAALRVFDNGALVRHLEFSEGEFIADEGTPLAGEESFLEEDFVDGDVLISELPRLAGITDPVDLFELRGQMYAVGA